MAGYLDTKEKSQCFGCEACVQICPTGAIKMLEDVEGFRYPHVDEQECRFCGLCQTVCPWEHPPEKSKETPIAFGGFHHDPLIREASTSGGAFSAIVNNWCDTEYAIFGVTADGLNVYHQHIEDKAELVLFRKSKYSQSIVGQAYLDAKEFLRKGKKVVFSGTPCQIAGLKSFLGRLDQNNLLTIEVVCEGVPSPGFIRSYARYIQARYHSEIKHLDYRDKDGKRWDFQVMTLVLDSGYKVKCDRWFNPFWSVWLDHLMSRPSCYVCPYATSERIADLTLGDLWGVHRYCPELYDHNGGASLIVCNTERGRHALKLARSDLIGHELDFQTALRYQGPMRRAIGANPHREEFMYDLRTLNYRELCNKWAKRPSLKLLWSKYVWGNRQKVFVWKIKRSLIKRFSVKG